MMEQLDLFALEPTEEWVFEQLYPSLLQVITDNNLAESKFKCVWTKYYSSVWYDTQMAFRICLRDGFHYFGVSDAFVHGLDESLANRITRDGYIKGFTNFSFDPSVEDIQQFASFLSSTLDQAIDGFTKEFDCCSRWEECSNAKKCTQPNPDIAIGCGYRKIMKKGHIFYGVNRNID